MTVSNKNNTIRRYHLYDSTGKEVELEKSEGEKEIGVLVDDQLTYSTAGEQYYGSHKKNLFIPRSAEFQIPFPGISKTTPRICRSSMVTIKGRGHRCTRKYPKKSHKTIPSLKNLEYTDRLKKLKMPTLKYRGHDRNFQNHQWHLRYRCHRRFTWPTL